MNETLQPFEHLAELLAALITAIRGRIDECMVMASCLVSAIVRLSEAPEVVAVKIDHSVTTICWTAGGCAVAMLVGLIYHAHVSRVK